MVSVIELFANIDKVTPLVRTLLVLIFSIVLFNFFIGLIKKAFLRRVKSKRQVSNVEIFSRVFKYFFFLIMVIFAFFSYVGSWTGFGLGIGLFSAALGWALQKPITGLAAWIMIITKRPFELGDRIIIGNVTGDLVDIGLTHIALSEVGGLVPSQENSGRVILIPNSVLFEQNIINYTAHHNEHVLDQVVVLIPFESNLDKAIKIAIESVKKCTKADSDFNNYQEPYIRTYFQPNGINVHVRYMVFAKKMQEVSSLITKEIYDRIQKERDVTIAYPHAEVIFKDRKNTKFAN
jgi:small-conductance mechanosensitive channel